MNNDQLEIGKLPPHAVELEEAVLGAVMLENDVLHEVIEILHWKNFYREEHGLMWKAIMAQHNDGKKVDILTVTERLASMGELDKVGGPYAVSVMTNGVNSTAHAMEHAAIIRQYAMLHDISRICTNAVKDCYDKATNPFELLNDMRNKFDNTSSLVMKGREVGSAGLFKELADHTEKATKNHELNIVTGVPSGLDKLDKLTNGWQDSDLIIIAARPSMGKTALTKKLIFTAIERLQRPVVMFSVEMSRKQLMARFASEDAGVSAQDILAGRAGDYYGKMNSETIPKFFDKKQNELLYIDDTTGISIAEARNRAIRMNREYDPCLFIFDYIQIMAGSKDKREQEVSEISRGLKGIARETNKPVIALSQLNREVESRSGDKRPRLSDLRESGAIEQDADIVGFIYRPIIYGFDMVDIGGREYPSENIAEIIIAKHRQGGLDNIPVKFTPHLTKFENFEEDAEFTSPQTKGDMINNKEL